MTYGVMSDRGLFRPPRHSWPTHKWISPGQTGSHTGRRSCHKSTDASATTATSATASLRLCLCDVAAAVMIDTCSYQHAFVITFVPRDGLIAFHHSCTKSHLDFRERDSQRRLRVSVTRLFTSGSIKILQKKQKSV